MSDDPAQELLSQALDIADQIGQTSRRNTTTPIERWPLAEGSCDACGHPETRVRCCWFLFPATRSEIRRCVSCGHETRVSVKTTNTNPRTIL